MSDNKPKIDLKARLGKKTVSTPAAASVPPPQVGMPRPQPSAPAAMPRPSAVPTPPQIAQQQAQRIDPTNPYASMPRQSAPVQARPTEIRVDMEEVRAAQRSGRGKVMALALVTAIVGGVIGFAFGGGSERAKGADAAIQGAQELLKEVDDSNKQITDLAETIKSARTKLLQKGTYPQEEITKLGAINIPLKSSSLADKSIGRFKRETLSMLIDFTAAVEEANDQKEGMQRLLGSASLKDYIEEQKTPKVRWIGYVGGGPGGPWISLEPLQKDKAFPAGTGWPAELEFKDDKGKVEKIKRYASGDPTGSEPPFLPVNPQSQGGVCPSDVVGSLIGQLLKMETVLRGDNTPGVDKTGLIERGQKLSEMLKKIGKGAS
jgi:hypothetical protein